MCAHTRFVFATQQAANYMDIKPLLDLTCAKVASMIKGKTPEQIRKTFNIQNDFTPAEEEGTCLLACDSVSYTSSGCSPDSYEDYKYLIYLRPVLFCFVLCSHSDSC